jgi:K+-sensing histidine kinase KdpD
MSRWTFLWGLILATLAARLVIGHLIDLPAVPHVEPFTVGLLVAAACLGVGLLVAARALVQTVRRREAGRGARPAPEEAVPSLDSRLDEAHREAHRQLAARSEQLAFVRKLLQARTAELERLERTAVASRLAEARADADRWRGKHERVTAELQGERVHFAGELARLSSELLHETREASRRADDLVEAQRELVRRTQETEGLRAEAAGLRAELIEAEARQLYAHALGPLCFEVRRALSAVLGCSRLLPRDAENRQQQDNARAIEMAGERLLSFVNRLDDLCRAQAQALALNPEAVDIETALREAAREGASGVGGKVSDFLVSAEPDLPLVHADPARLAQMLAALVQYGIASGGEMVLSARPAGEFVALDVALRGVAVAGSAHLFDPLAADGEDDATGARLALTRRLATLSGGELTVSEGATGAVFTVTLPRWRSPKGQPP